MKLRHTAIPAVYALIHKWDGLLFMRRRNTGYMDGMLGLPSGHVELGESLTQALVREVYEEIGVRLSEISSSSSTRDVVRQKMDCAWTSSSMSVL